MSTPHTLRKGTADPAAFQACLHQLAWNAKANPFHLLFGKKRSPPR